MFAPEEIVDKRYRILGQLGQGGTGTVYKAVDQATSSVVALKQLLFTEETMRRLGRPVTQKELRILEALRKEFEQEALTLSSLHHSSLPRVLDYAIKGDSPYLVMEYVPGDNLQVKLRLNNTPFPVTQVLMWADQLLDALDHIHTQEPPIIHQDIKPQNLKVNEKGRVMLLDFGFAKPLISSQPHLAKRGDSPGYTRQYAPPEQLQNTGSDPRSDLYSLAATLYLLMTKVEPAAAPRRLSAFARGEVDPLILASEVNKEVPVEVACVLRRAMSLSRNGRPVSAEEMWQQLAMAISQKNSN